MKFVVLLSLILSGLSSCRQTKDQAIKSVDRIFGVYIKQDENADSKDNETEMKHALESLQTTYDVSHVPKLIEVWMYYDPTDFPTRELILPIFRLNKSESLKAIDFRMKNKKEWESGDNAPYSDLISLRKQISK